MAKAKIAATEPSTEAPPLTCVHCRRALEAKEQPQFVDGEVWCPRDFVAVLMHRDPERHSPTTTAAVRCQFCAWITVCRTMAEDGAACTCGMCGKHGAIRLPNQRQPHDRASAATG